MSVHKLTAGDGYLYLTRQTAASDGTDLGRVDLADYYTAKGEQPGRWVGSAITDLNVAGTVEAAQMKALFGEGLHPDADALQVTLAGQGYSASEITAAITLGQKFRQPVIGSPFPKELAKAIGHFNVAHGRPQRAAIGNDERARIRTRVARDMFTAEYSRPPTDDRELSGWLARNSRLDTMPVAGFDLTFSPVKSVSTLWALAPRDVADVIAAAHEQSVAEAVAWVEANALFTRTGRDGVRQVDVTGLIGASFTHRDSRAGDPDLHTHVAVSNKVRTLDVLDHAGQVVEAGRWLSIDGRLLYKANVAASEIYNSAVERRLRDQLGVRFSERPGTGGRGRRGIREIAGVPAELMGLWSSRRVMIEDRHAELVADFRAAHGRTPTAKEQIALAQTATLDTRQRKHEPRSHAEQRDQWRREAAAAIGETGITQMLLATTGTRQARPERVTPALIRTLAASTMDTVTEHRSTWQVWHVQAEALRQVRAAGVAPDRELAVVADVVDRAMTGRELITLHRRGRLDPGVTTPGVLRRRDGESVYDVHGATVYTTTAVRAAEDRIVAAAHRSDGWRIAAFHVGVAVAEMHANGVDLNTGQRTLLTAVATTGARVQLALAPAGTGKTTAMRALAGAVDGAGGRVVGLAPSSSAASELGEAIGASADTLDKLTFHIRNQKQYGLESWMRAIGKRTVVIIDEAGLASTKNLDTAISWILARGARVVLIGDDRQLSSVAAGGVLRDIASSAGYVTLNSVVRFAHEGEGPASLALRERDPAGLAFYIDHGRVHVGDATSTLDQAFAAWSRDRDRGWDSVMLAATHDDVTELNARARAARLATPGAARHTQETAVGMGLSASVGDTVITKKNNRLLPLGQSDFVRNGYRWDVTDVHADGSLTVRHLVTARTVTLPAAYVTEHVLLGYASVIDSAQGMTVGAPARSIRGSSHTVVDPDTMVSEQLYTALTRGVDENHAYVRVVHDGDQHTAVHPDTLHPSDAAELLTAVVTRSGAQVSAGTAAAELDDPCVQMARITARYCDALNQGAAAVIGPARMAQLAAAAEALRPGLTNQPAWPTLHAHLALLELNHADPIAALTAAAQRRELDTADDAAAVLDWRLDPAHDRAASGVLPWVYAVPPALAADPLWGPYLRQTEWHVEDTRVAIGEVVAGWTRPGGAADAPRWVRPLLYVDAHPALIADVAVWRYAHGVDDADRRPTGPPVLATAERRHQTDLDTKVAAAGWLQDRAVAAWTALATSIDPRIVADPYWPDLAARLESAHRAGDDAASRLRDAVALRPLPDVMPAAVLWTRMAPAMGGADADLGGLSLRPDWSRAMDQVLDDDTTLRVLAAPLWPALVDRIDAAAARGEDPAALFAQALDAHRGDLAHPHQMVEAMLFRVAPYSSDEPLDLETLSPVQIPVDPAGADIEAPHDLDQLHDRPSHRTDGTGGPFGDVDRDEPPADPDDPYDLDYLAAEAAAWVAPAAPTSAAHVEPVDHESLDDVLDWASESAFPNWNDGFRDPTPYPDLAPELRVRLIETDLDQARASLTEQQQRVRAGTATNVTAVAPMILAMRARADKLAPLVHDRDYAYTEWATADRAAEAAARDVAAARAALATLLADAPPSDRFDPATFVALPPAGQRDYLATSMAVDAARETVAVAELAAHGPAAAAAEAHAVYRAADTALTTAAGEQGVVRNVDVDVAAALARDLDDDHTRALRTTVRGLSDALLRAEMTAARAALPEMAHATMTSTDDTVKLTGFVGLGDSPPPVPPAERWADLVAAIDPTIPTAGTAWEELATTISDAESAGYDIEGNLPRLAAAEPLPPTTVRAATELRYRIIEILDANGIQLPGDTGYVPSWDTTVDAPVDDDLHRGRDIDRGISR